MGIPSYLLKKKDIYYYRQACSNQLKALIGQREVVRSLGVKEKATAIRMAREFKVIMDDLIDYQSIGDVNKKDFLSCINSEITTLRTKYGEQRTVLPDAGTLNAPKITTPLQSLKEKNYHRGSVGKVKVVPVFESKPKKNIEPLIKKFCAEKVRLKRWTQKTYLEKQGHFELVVKSFKNIKGIEEIFIEDLTKEDVRSLREILLILPKNHRKHFPNQTIHELVTMCEKVDNESGSYSDEQVALLKQKMSLNTIVEKYSVTIKNFWKWLMDQNYIENDVFTVLKFDGSKIKNSWKSYTKEELLRLFSGRIYEKQEYLYNYQYWLPLLAIFTGGRLHELCQLRVSDISSENNIKFISITKDSETTLKTHHSERKIPIHPDLIKCGFLRFVESQRRKKERFIFSELVGLNGLVRSRRVSQWFNDRYKVKAKVGEKRTFHSFRRVVINELSTNGVRDFEIRSIIGHKPEGRDTLNNHYKDDISLERKKILIEECIKYRGYEFPWRR